MTVSLEGNLTTSESPVFFSASDWGLIRHTTFMLHSSAASFPVIFCYHHLMKTLFKYALQISSLSTNSSMAISYILHTEQSVNNIPFRLIFVIKMILVERG